MPIYTLFNHNVNKEGIAIIKELQKLLHNNWLTSAQHVADNRTTADVRLHNSCCAADDSISYDNLSYLFKQLFLSFQTTNHSISKFYLYFFPLFFLILRIIIYLCDINQTITADNKDILFLLT